MILSFDFYINRFNFYSYFPLYEFMLHFQPFCFVPPLRISFFCNPVPNPIYAFYVILRLILEVGSDRFIDVKTNLLPPELRLPERDFVCPPKASACVISCNHRRRHYFRCRRAYFIVKTRTSAISFIIISPVVSFFALEL